MDIEKICNEVLDVLNPCYDIEMSLRNSFITDLSEFQDDADQ